jgi:Uma2 family endonuclease
MTVQIVRRQFTVDDYYRMLDAGILSEDDRVELIDGEIREMSAIDAVHAGTVTRLSQILNRQIGDRFIISVQNPIRLNETNEPQPDLAVLRWHDDFYDQHHPTPADVLILIEVANTSLVYERTEKVPRYAAAGIPEVWLVDIAHRAVEQYAQPVNGQYIERKVLARGSLLQATVIPGLELPIDRMFGL